eukprot:XP_011666651.1 PREDICTED: uncharacterized protein LOC105439413 [Strongylocentrotus purpuratus]
MLAVPVKRRHVEPISHLNSLSLFFQDILTVMPGYKHSKSDRVSLVSQGAEAIKISKSFFLKYADERVFTEIEMRFEPYPDQDTCLKDLGVTTEWQRYKKVEMEQTMHEVKDKVQLRIASR